MDILQKPPDWLTNLLPEGGARDFVNGPGWFVVLGVGGLVILLILWMILKAMLGGKKPAAAKTPNLEEDLGIYPALQPSTGDRQLRAEGVPVRHEIGCGRTGWQ